MQNRADRAEAQREPIAVVGIGCRLPGGVRSADDFWTLLDEGRDAIVDIPADRWSTDRYYESERTPGKSRVRRGGFLTASAEANRAAAAAGGSDHPDLPVRPGALLLLHRACFIMVNHTTLTLRACG